MKRQQMHLSLVVKEYLCSHVALYGYKHGNENDDGNESTHARSVHCQKQSIDAFVIMPRVSVVVVALAREFDGVENALVRREPSLYAAHSAKVCLHRATKLVHLRCTSLEPCNEKNCVDVPLTLTCCSQRRTTILSARALSTRGEIVTHDGSRNRCGSPTVAVIGKET